MTKKGARRSAEEKREVVLTYLAGKTPVAELCRAHQISSTTLYKWRDQFLEGGLLGLQGETTSKREDRLAQEVTELRDLVGDLALANHLLKKGGPSTGNRRGGW